MSTPTITGRTITKGTASFESMFAELRDLHSKIGGAEEPPKGAFSAEQYAKANGITRAVAYNLLNRQVQAGAFRKLSVRAKCENGSIRSQSFFVRAK